MTYEKKHINRANNLYDSKVNTKELTRSVYWAVVSNVEDPIGGGRIKVRIPDLDDKTPEENLPWCYPMIPRFFHVFPKPNELVRVILEDVKYPNKVRFWVGSIISQYQKINFDNNLTALSTSANNTLRPLENIENILSAEGVFPEREDIGFVGRVNTDFLLKENEVSIRAGKHLRGDVTTRNDTNPSEIKLNFDFLSGQTRSSQIMIADKIALISHEGVPKFPASQLNQEIRTRIFDEGHPIPRGDILVAALNIIREALVTHIHGYSGIEADKSSIIEDLENLNFNAILQENIVIN